MRLQVLSAGMEEVVSLPWKRQVLQGERSLPGERALYHRDTWPQPLRAGRSSADSSPRPRVPWERGAALHAGLQAHPPGCSRRRSYCQGLGVLYCSLRTEADLGTVGDAHTSPTTKTSYCTPHRTVGTLSK